MTTGVAWNSSVAVRCVFRFLAQWQPMEDRQRFINLVHAEQKSLHEGDIARFRLRQAKIAAGREKATYYDS